MICSTRPRTAPAGSGSSWMPLDTGEADPLGHALAQRVAAVHLVGAEGHHEQAAALEPAREQEADQVAGAGVGPVGVLDHEEDRAEGSQVLDEGIHRLEHLGPVEALGGLVGRCAGDAGGESAGWRSLLERARGRPRRPGRASRRRGGRASRSRRSRDSARRRTRQPCVARLVGRLGQEAGLADTGVAREEDHPGLVGTCTRSWPGSAFGAGSSTEQDLELAVTADETLGPAPVHPHIGHHPAR